MKFNFKSKILFISIFFFTLTFSALLWARAGGAGGGSRSSGSRSSGGYSSHSSGGGYGRSYGNSGYNNYSNGADSGYSTAIFLVFVAIFIIYIYMKKNNQNLDAIDEDPNADTIDDQIFQDVKVTVPDSEFKNKAYIAFMTIQKAWSEKNLSLMRRFITDGVYQRFNAQFTMMNLLDQINPISGVIVHNIGVVKTRIDGNYEIMDIQIKAYAKDKFTSPKFPNLDSPGNAENFMEYWSFIRRVDYQKGTDIYHSELCPKCSAPLKTKLVESAQCPYCSTYLNNGEYDWVLAEITQSDDYSESKAIAFPKELKVTLPDFSIQLIEDRASNAFMQILIATAKKDIAPLTRFSSTNALTNLKKIMSETTFLYDRLFLNAVEVSKVEYQNHICKVTVDIVFSSRKVLLQNQKAQLLNEEIETDSKQIILMRELSDNVSKGSIFANSCPHCGGAQKDSLSSSCAYCSQPLNDPKSDWVVDQIL